MHVRFHFFERHLNVHLIAKECMFQSSFGRNTILGVSIQHFDQKVEGRCWDLRVAFFGESEITSSILSQDLVVLFPFKN